MLRVRDAIMPAVVAVCVCACATAPAAAASTGRVVGGVVSTGQSGWGWGAPAPQGQDLNAVTFQGATGYAVGNLGTVLRSDDTGQSWSGLASDTTADLHLVQELTPTTVVVAGGCAVLESTDSGASFTALPLGLGDACQDPVVAIAFSDPEHGYVELRSGALFYTDDGGATLQAKSSPPVGVGTAVGLAFNSPTTGVAVSSGGMIERTTDGGNSWAQVGASPTGLNAVTFVSPTLGYAVGGAGVFTSTDGGATWSTVPLTLLSASFPPDLTGITCADPQDCLMTTSDSNELVRTSDGGTTDVEVSVSNEALAGVAYATGSTVVGVGDEGATVISDDGGQTFPSVSANALAGFVADGSLVPGAAAGTAYLPGRSGIAATGDSGANWSLLRVPTDGQPIDSVAFSSTQVGYALDRGGVLRRTTDGGMSWRSFAAGHSPSSQIVASTSTRLLLVGPEGIFRSTDGGASFRAVAGRVRGQRLAGAPVASLRLNSAVHARGAVVAYEDRAGKGPVVVSSDAGRTWRSVPLPPHPRSGAVDVSAISASRLWYLQDGRLWATTDAGRHWQTVPGIGRLGVITEVSFSSAQDGLAGLASSAKDTLGAPLDEVSALQTTDGGRTWVPEVIAGQSFTPSHPDLLATPTGDLGVLSYNTSAVVPVSPPVGFFTTAGVAVPTRHTKLTVKFAHPRMSAAALAQSQHQVLVTGHLSPVLSSDERVAVSFQTNRGDWRVTQARVASSGAFRLNIKDVRLSAAVLAQATGTGAVTGAGTPVQEFTVSR